MLKKAGIVVATSAVAILAISPLAFAADNGSDTGKATVDLSHNSVEVPVNACHNTGIGANDSLNNPKVTPAAIFGILGALPDQGAAASDPSCASAANAVEGASGANN